MAGKGDSPRPLSVSDEQFRANYDAIDWSDARRNAEEATKPTLFMGKQHVIVPNPLNGVEFNTADFGVIAVDSDDR